MSKWQGFYSTEQVSRLASIPKYILYHWKKIGLIPPL
jgi:DNA-binding transcriptional MerR regulator